VGGTGPDGSTGWDRLEAGFGAHDDFAGELLGYADAVVVESPAELRDAVVARLRAVCAGSSPGETP
jgi:proteasome accessory factor B